MEYSSPVGVNRNVAESAAFSSRRPEKSPYHAIFRQDKIVISTYFRPNARRK
jgi:hypothetical protein